MIIMSAEVKNAAGDETRCWHVNNNNLENFYLLSFINHPFLPNRRVEKYTCTLRPKQLMSYKIYMLHLNQ